MPDKDFTPALEDLARDRSLLGEIRKRIEQAERRWLPGVGECYNVTIDAAEREAFLKLIR